ncbi:tyrosine-type recombinase/integrase [Patescibacteria group bacterium]|nr:tyrosine-type recombinase/integrase [Patescibacteria group bacterium]
MAKDIKSLLEKFLKELRNKKKLSLATVNNYTFYLKRFLIFGKITNINQLSKEKIKAFVDHLNQPSGKNKVLNAATQNYHLIALRSFLKFLTNKGFKVIPAENIRLNKTRPKIYPLPDLEKILTLPLKTKNTAIIKLRDEAILELLLTTGLKVSELVNLKVASLDFKKGQLKISLKKSQSRKVPLDNQCQYSLKQYLASRKETADFLFISHDRACQKRSNTEQKLTPRSVQRLVKKYTKMAELSEQITPQTFRRFYISSLLSKNSDLKNIQDKLGHASVNIIKMYK